MADVSEPSKATRYAAATGAIESTAKWLVTAFAGIGALIVGGLQLTSLGALDRTEWPRLAIAIVSFCVLVTAIGYLIRETSAIFLTDWVTLAELSDEAFNQEVRSGEILVNPQNAPPARIWKLELLPPPTLSADAGLSNPVSASTPELRILLEKIDAVREELYGHVARTIPKLHMRLRLANEAAAAITAGESKVTQEEQERVFAMVEELRNAARAVVECANYHRTRQRFSRLMKRLALAGAVIVLSVLLFAYATNPPTDPEGPIKVEVVTTQPETTGPSRTP
jgi:hypothetical protein